MNDAKKLCQCLEKVKLPFVLFLETSGLRVTYPKD